MTDTTTNEVQPKLLNGTVVFYSEFKKFGFISRDNLSGTCSCISRRYETRTWTA